MTTTIVKPAKPAPEPLYFIIWHRRPGERKWRRAGRTTTHAEAVSLVGGKGDWHIAPLHDERLAGEKERPTNGS